MSRECIRFCPRIQEAIQDFPEGAHPQVATEELLNVCEATYDCPGPVPTEVEVIVGGLLSKKRAEAQTVYMCGLDN